MIPIIIVSYNNHLYVENTIKQIQKINSTYLQNILIMDNNSTDPDTILYMENIIKTSRVKVIRNEINKGPWVSHYQNAHIYNMMPDKFILTDPDLEFNKDLPSNFIEVLEDLSNKYPASKLGFALKIDDYSEDMFTGDNYFWGKNIYDWESKFWKNKIINEKDYELYHADIDTTFALHNKKYFCGRNENSIRIAGNFTAKHLPWYKTKDLFNLYEKYNLSKKTTTISTMGILVFNYINNNYLDVKKNGHAFLIENDNKQLLFWKDIYPSWNDDYFKIYDSMSSKDKAILDIGYNVELTTVYFSRISKKVFSINCNKSESEKTKTIKKIIRNNCSNATVYDCDFGENLNYDFLNNFLINNNINNYQELSFINIDMNGLEENMMQNLYQFQKKIGTPIIIHLNLLNWKDKDVNRFSFLHNAIDDQNSIVILR